MPPTNGHRKVVAFDRELIVGRLTVGFIFFAKPGGYKKATIKIFDGGSAASFVELPVVQAASK
jgi:hypothetical protein